MRSTPKPNSIIQLLKQAATAARSRLPEEAFRLIGMSRTSYVLKLTEIETILHLHYVTAQTIGHGCCYYDASTDEPGIAETIVGSDALSVNGDSPIAIAALDAVFASIIRDPDDQKTIDGQTFQKASLRARIVCEEAYRLLRQMKKRRDKWTIANIGVIGTILSMLGEDSTIRVTASDYYRGVAGKTVHGAKVEYGVVSPELIRAADVAIVTGMTLANNTLPELLDAARESGTRMVVFAQTGANFAEEYTRLGVDSIVSEPFPFYLVGSGPNVVRIYRRQEN